MQVALISYLEARQRLQDKRRGRGFWPAHGTGKSKGKSKFNKGSFKANTKVDRTCWPRSRSPDAGIAINLAIGKPSAL